MMLSVILAQHGSRERWCRVSVGWDGKLNPEQAKVFVDDMMQQLRSEARVEFSHPSGNCGI